MTTRAYDITDQPVNLRDEIGAPGDYLLSNTGQKAIYLSETQAAPDVDVYARGKLGHPVLPGDSWSFSLDTVNLWCWTHPDGSSIVVSDA